MTRSRGEVRLARGSAEDETAEDDWYCTTCGAAAEEADQICRACGDSPIRLSGGSAFVTVGAGGDLSWGGYW